MVDVELEGSVAGIFLNRPEKANALNSAMLAALAAALESLELETLRVVVEGPGAGKRRCLRRKDWDEASLATSVGASIELFARAHR